MPDTASLGRASLPRPDVSAVDAAEILRRHWGLEGRISELGSQQDRNFRIDAEAGRFVLKICRGEYDTVELEAQNAAMLHLRSKPDMALVPAPVAASDGRRIVAIEINGAGYQARLLDYLDGEPLTRRNHLPEATVAELGGLCARVARGLEDFHHAGLDRLLQWDLSRAHAICEDLLAGLPASPSRDRIAATMEAAERLVRPLADGLRIQPIHHDITDDNVVARPDAKGVPMPCGVIDFGDLMSGWLVADLAVTCASLLHHAAGDPFFILPAIGAFHAVHPLTTAELKALWPLVVQRAGILVASSELQMAIEPDNAYVLGNIDHERAIFSVATSVPMELMQAAILASAGIAADALPAMRPLLPDIDPATITLADLSLLSPAFEAGNWGDAGIDASVLDAAARVTGCAATRYGEFRLSRTAEHSATAPDTCALHVELRLQTGTAVAAPFGGRISRTGDGMRLAGEAVTLLLAGAVADTDDGTDIAAGAVFAKVGVDGRLVVRLSRLVDIDPPQFATPGRAVAWGRLAPSPSALLGLNCDAQAPQSDALLQSRQSHFARPQKNYYRNPPQIERGWRQHLYDVTGRAYLDMVNNVTILGHGHPRLAAAVGRQWGLLNTNSRFHYAGIAEFAERLATLAPDGLDTVFLVNSGSEANDLALRLAWAHSGARNMLCLLEAYHGWTVASDAVSTSIADNPQALTTRPPWVHAITSPNTYRGPFRGPDSAAGYIAAAEAALTAIEAKGEGLGGFISETVYGNSGGIPLPRGYLEAVYAMVRAKGGVTIADEVQVGYGRLGHYFWGFEEQGVTPDIITVAKGMGNGHPLGAVITSRAIADSLEKEGYFFSSAGGSPVSCVVGMTVLDVLEEEGLQANARDVGSHLKTRLEALGQRFPLVGAVHGMGLYLGLEFVRDRETLEPATEETAGICDRLLDFGVIMQPTGDHLNVLKIKPPMCLTRQSADFFADMLGRVLEEGW